MLLPPRARRLVEVVCVVALLGAGWAVRWQLPADHTWRFAGSDSYGYLGIAREWYAHGRYAMGPAPQPLAWWRVPGYPAFLLLVCPTADMNGSWQGLIVAQQLVDLATALLVWWMARRLAGRVAGLVALTLAVFNPFTLPFTAAMLTEVLATMLTTATAAVILAGADRPLRWWPVAGALLGASTLVRPDGLIVGVAFLPAWLALRVDWRARLRIAAVAALGFVVVFAPWPLRNLVRFGRPHIAASGIDRFSKPVDYGGYFAWLRSWAPDWGEQTYPLTCFFDRGCPMADVRLRARGAYRDLDDEAVVNRLIALRDRSGPTDEVSRGFAELAAARRRAHPFRVVVELPLQRAWSMWVSPFDELYQGRLPWPRVMRYVSRYTRRWARAQFLAVLAAAAILLARRATRVPAATLALPIFVRTVILAWTFYCLPRYAIEVMPLGWVLVSVALVTLAGTIRDRLQRSAA